MDEVECGAFLTLEVSAELLNSSIDPRMLLKLEIADAIDVAIDDPELPAFSEMPADYKVVVEFHVRKIDA